MNNYSLFVKFESNVIIVLLVYVDDIMLPGNNNDELEKFMHKPRKSHLDIAFRVLWYLKSNHGKGISITNSSNFSLVGYVDAGRAKCLVSRSSVTGYFVSLGIFCNNVGSYGLQIKLVCYSRIVEIVGVTSTRKTFSVGFDFIHREKEANYTWVLNCVKSILDKCLHPRVIITNRELALINACETVFLDATRQLCRWHIEQNILKISSKIITLDDDQDSFRILWNLLVGSPTLMAYTENYQRLQSMLIKYPRVMRYIDDTWLNKYMEMFVSVWSRESTFKVKKKKLNSANSNLDKFVQRMNQVVQSQLTSIKESFENSLTVRYNHHNLLCFQLLRGHVSNEALDIILGEIQRLGDLMLDSSNCGCKLRNSCGLPCACMISFYSISGENIPLNSIYIFWRKLDISDTTPVADDDINYDDVVNKFKENFNKQSKVGKMFYRRKLEEIYDPQKLMLENLRVKKQQKKKVNPLNHAPHRCSFSTTSEFNGVNLNTEPERHSFSCGINLNDEPQSHSFSCGISLNDEPQRHYPFQMNAIPGIFHDYIDDIRDVEGDGNCGFRAIALCLGQYYAYQRVFTDGFNEVYQSLRWFQSPTPFQEHWLHMPLSGYLIANKFGVIVHCLSHEQNTTCFPLWRGPEEFQPHRAITLALVNGIHYMSVFLKGNYPMPPTTGYWNAHKSASASTWQTMYWPRFDLLNQLRSRASETPWIHIED
uniref:MULE transposase domain-containing protein n=1 Tax=Lactuca sativa TaxID=4236 RepID=A0A9R1WGG2_LACSA|nr:hypothetical protein LSAT_V11C100044820 [Lactuca sativa]